MVVEKKTRQNNPQRTNSPHHQHATPRQHHGSSINKCRGIDSSIQIREAPESRYDIHDDHSKDNSNNHGTPDQAGRRIVLQGTIHSSPALLLAERAAFASSHSSLDAFSTSLSHIHNLGDNDIYRWFMAHSPAGQAQPPDLKINLIYPCTDQHVKKYTAQPLRHVTETPEIYRHHVRPFMQSKRDQGRLNWVFNILDGRTEQDHVLFRSPHDTTPEDERYLLLPDLNWDRKTLGSLHVLALVQRRDIWSVRDLKKKHVGWLQHLVADIATTLSRLYGIDADMLKSYVHCMLFLLPCFFFDPPN
jgi:m7GpppX diphosphatase